jgi:glycosyltransferase involved in cell wall biosynthesis
MPRLVLLATYNGAVFLPAQLESIFSQSCGWELLVRDDGSTDGTKELLRHKAASGASIRFIDDGQTRLGARGNFARLLEKAGEMGADYCTLSDQDDVWLPSKLAEQFTLMKSLEQKFPCRPILIHSDLEVVNQDLETIHTSFMHYQGIHHEEVVPLKVLLCQNFVTGSTVMINRPLLELALPVPQEALMHDWWLALCAAAFGKLEYCKKPLVRYRQHQNNVVGARNVWRLLNPLQNNWQTNWYSGCDNLAKSLLQARVLAARIKEREPRNPHLQLIEDYASLMELSPPKRIRTIKKSGIHMQSIVRHALMVARLSFS